MSAIENPIAENIYVLSCGYRSSRFALKCIDSVQNQTLKPKMHYYIDDASEDDTAPYLYDAWDKYRHTRRLEITLRNERFFKLANMSILLNSEKFNDNDVICVLDGDDWLELDALEKVSDVYSSHQDLEYVYTNWRFSHNGEIGISQQIPDSSWEPYSNPWITSAMSTFRYGLWRNIHQRNFTDWDGSFFKMACDQAYILPMLKYLKDRDGDYRSVGFINEPLYVYQFLENENKPRCGDSGAEMSALADRCSRFIRSRGYCL